MTTKPTICRCGSKLFEESTPVLGVWKATIDEHGETLDTNLDSIRHRRYPKTVICLECGRRCPNPRYG